MDGNRWDMTGSLKRLTESQEVIQPTQTSSHCPCPIMPRMFQSERVDEALG